MGEPMIKLNWAIAISFAAILTFISPVLAQNLQPTRIIVNGVELHYIEAGTGETVILLHGGTGDYRSWSLHWDAFARYYHVISYSRRYHYPNNNPKILKNYSALNEAEDLAALIQKLKLRRVHLVGGSYGALTALALALEHPKMVRSLVLSEPPIHSWMEGTDGYRDFMANWDRCGSAFRKGNQTEAMKIFTDGLFGSGYLDRVPSATSSAMMQNARAIQALALSKNPFPNLSKDKVMKLNIPTLILTGDNTIKVHRAVDDELTRLLPNAKHVIVPNAGHATARDNPEDYRATVLDFLSRQK